MRRSRSSDACMSKTAARVRSAPRDTMAARTSSSAPTRLHSKDLSIPQIGDVGSADVYPNYGARTICPPERKRPRARLGVVSGYRSRGIGSRRSSPARRSVIEGDVGGSGLHPHPAGPAGRFTGLALRSDRFGEPALRTARRGARSAWMRSATDPIPGTGDHLDRRSGQRHDLPRIPSPKAPPGSLPKPRIPPFPRIAPCARQYREPRRNLASADVSSLYTFSCW